MNARYKVIERVGDRKPDAQFSVKDYAFTINANSMSDRCQFIVEINKRQQKLKDRNIVASRGRGGTTGGNNWKQAFEPRKDYCTNSITNAQKDNFLLETYTI